MPRRSASGDSDCGLCAELCTLTIYDELCNLCTVQALTHLHRTKDRVSRNISHDSRYRRAFTRQEPNPLFKLHLPPLGHH